MLCYNFQIIFFIYYPVFRHQEIPVHNNLRCQILKYPLFIIFQTYHLRCQYRKTIMISLYYCCLIGFWIYYSFVFLHSIHFSTNLF